MSDDVSMIAVYDYNMPEATRQASSPKYDVKVIELLIIGAIDVASKGAPSVHCGRCSIIKLCRPAYSYDGDTNEDAGNERKGYTTRGCYNTAAKATNISNTTLLKNWAGQEGNQNNRVQGY